MASDLIDPVDIGHHRYASGVIPWAQGCARGWIAAADVRIPLATPTAGLAFEASVGA